MKLALPQAKSGIYLALALGVTFPFNLTFCMPTYFLLASLQRGIGFVIVSALPAN